MTIQERSSAGFTVIEGAVVLVILGVMAAVLLPAFTFTAQRTQANACLDNLRQIGQAVLLYAEDHDGEISNRSARHNLNFIPPWHAKIPELSMEDMLLVYGIEDATMRSPLDTISPLEREFLPWIDEKSHFGLARTSYRMIEGEELPTTRLNDLAEPESTMLVRTPNYHLFGDGFAAFMTDGSARMYEWTAAAELTPNHFGPLE